MFLHLRVFPTTSSARIARDLAREGSLMDPLMSSSL